MDKEADFTESNYLPSNTCVWFHIWCEPRRERTTRNLTEVKPRSPRGAGHEVAFLHRTWI